MNNERRKTLADLHKRLDNLRGEIEAIRDELESIKDEEQEYFDNMPESFQQGERGQRAEEVIGYLETAWYVLEALDFDEILSSIDEATA